MISNEEIIFNKLVEVYPSAMSELTSLSFNDSGNRQFIISDFQGFNYDTVMNCSSVYKIETKEKSPDALFFHNEKLYFIEFKEGRAKKEDIRLKIHEGVTTLYHFVCKHLPSITRQEFIELKINYAVVCRGDGSKSMISAEMINVLENTSKKYSLKNLEGFLVKQTAVIEEPNQLLKFLNRISTGSVTSITVFEHLGQTQTFSLPA
ncbi:hypothetical protein VC899_13205 [Citrobacter braakii]|uniref:hypothetical protein n=1 Tax=Citrobacter braakii TaxID=57706 RepID=UPI002B24481E|nr:hypothetical protein [Citrobacter braakii]MEB0966144.1 hypothetical protein [Citrobacter braakii]